MLAVPSEQQFLKRREFEEKVCCGDGFGRTAAIWTVFAGLHVDVGIVVNAVLPGVVTGVDETVLAAQLEKPLRRVGVLQVGGADKLVALDAEFVPEGAPLGGHLRDKFGFRDAGFFGGALAVDAVLLGARGHNPVSAAHALSPAGCGTDEGRAW